MLVTLGVLAAPKFQYGSVNAVATQERSFRQKCQNEINENVLIGFDRSYESYVFLCFDGRKDELK